MSRVDQRNVTVSIDGKPLGTFDKKSGGAIDSDETKYRPGNMGRTLSLGGNQMVENVTVQRLCDLDRDWPLLRGLAAGAGRARAVVSEQPLDAEGNPHGSPIVYTGTLKSVTLPDIDSDANDPALVQLEISTDGTIG